jgi:hypothetical protein
LSETLSHIKSLKESLGSIQCPAPWEAHFSDKYGRVYYYNPLSGESVWECPRVESQSRDTGQGGRDEGSVSSSGASRIEDSLLQKGIAYQTKLQEARQRQEEQRQAEVTGKPQLSKYALAKGGNRDAGASIIERTNNTLKLKKEREERAKQEMIEKEQSQVTSNPTITKKSQKLNRSVDDMLSWDEARKAKIEAKQIEQQRKQESELSLAPHTESTRAVNDRLLRNRRSKIDTTVPVIYFL